MKTKAKTTYILLDRGTEDVDLYNELLKIQSKIKELGFESGADFIKAFPKFTELRQGLYDEISSDI